MVSPEHVEKQKTEDKQVSSPAEKTQVPTVVENTRPWLKPLKRTLGTVMPLIGGFVWIWCILLAVEQWNDITGTGMLGVLAVFVLGTVCVVLLFPFWWAIVVVPLAFAFGELLAFFVGVPLHSYNESYSIVATYSMALPFSVILGFVVALVGASIGFLINGLLKNKAKQ
jgi:hypothetical protein